MPQPAYDPKHEALTLYQSFEEEVLLLAKPLSASKWLTVPIDIRSRGVSTQKANPPAVWFPRHVGTYLSKAQQLCDKHERPLNRSYLPAPYVPCPLVTEADVVRSAALWLIHPVVKALQNEYSNVECLAEVTSSDCRCDAMIKIDGLEVVVLEYKNRGYIKAPEFLQGCIKDSTPANRSEIVRKIGQAVNGTTFKTLMNDDAACLTKQAAAYATRYGTRYVGLFDWDSFFLWNFAGMKFNPGSRDLPDGHARWAYGTMVTNREDYRKALLGFVMEAYANRRHPGYERGQREPFEISPIQQAKMRKEAEERRLAQLGPKKAALSKVFGRRD